MVRTGSETDSWEGTTGGGGRDRTIGKDKIAKCQIEATLGRVASIGGGTGRDYKRMRTREGRTSR